MLDGNDRGAWDVDFCFGMAGIPLPQEHPWRVKGRLSDLIPALTAGFPKGNGRVCMIQELDPDDTWIDYTSLLQFPVANVILTGRLVGPE